MPKSPSWRDCRHACGAASSAAVPRLGGTEPIQPCIHTRLDAITVIGGPLSPISKPPRTGHRELPTDRPETPSRNPGLVRPGSCPARELRVRLSGRCHDRRGGQAPAPAGSTAPGPNGARAQKQWPLWTRTVPRNSSAGRTGPAAAGQQEQGHPEHGRQQQRRPHRQQHRDDLRPHEHDYRTSEPPIAPDTPPDLPAASSSPAASGGDPPPPRRTSPPTRGGCRVPDRRGQQVVPPHGRNAAGSGGYAFALIRPAPR